MNAEIGVGFIGAGDIFTYHAPGIKECSGVKPIGLFDVSSSRAQERAQQFGLEVFPSAETLVSDPRVHAILILTPLEVHFPNAKLALEAGKHVLIEKPVGVTIAEIKEMKRLADERNLVCMPGHNNIYHPRMGEIKEAIDAGDLGKLSYLSILYNIHHPEEVARKYPGVIRQVMTHHAYTLLYLGGLPKKVQALKAVQHYTEFTEEDIAVANLEMENGALAHLEVNFAGDDHSTDPWSLFIKVIGTKGAERFSHNDSVVNAPGIVHSHTYSTYPRTIRNEDAHFIACVRGEKQPLSTLDDAIMAQQIIEGIEQSIKEERTIKLS